MRRQPRQSWQWAPGWPPAQPWAPGWGSPPASRQPERPRPQFRHPQVDRQVDARGLPAEKYQYLGWQAGFRVLPYRMQDQYTRQRQPVEFQSIVLENEILKAVFLPQLGGRLISLFHKPYAKELLHRNPVFQPANLAIRNAWFSGGIEWNCGQFGHSFTTCFPVFAARITGAQGEPGLRLYEFERCKSLFWQIDLYLPPASPFLFAHVSVANPNPAPASMDWWTNVAVDESPDVRVLAPARKAIYVNFSGSGIGYGLDDLAVYHFYPSLDQARQWIDLAGLAIEEEGAGSGYYHFLTRNKSEG